MKRAFRTNKSDTDFDTDDKQLDTNNLPSENSQEDVSDEESDHRIRTEINSNQNSSDEDPESDLNQSQSVEESEPESDYEDSSGRDVSDDLFYVDSDSEDEGSEITSEDEYESEYKLDTSTNSEDDSKPNDNTPLQKDPHTDSESEDSPNRKAKKKNIKDEIEEEYKEDETLVYEMRYIQDVIIDLKRYMKNRSVSDITFEKVTDEIPELLEYYQKLFKEKSSETNQNLLEIHKIKISQGKLNWFDHKDLATYVWKIIEFFEIFDTDEQFKYINFDRIKEVLTIDYFQDYFKKQIDVTGKEEGDYKDVINFHSSLLNVLTSLYVKSLLAFQPSMKAATIHLIDPFMRNEIREINFQFFESKIKKIHKKFNFYAFISSVFNRYILTRLPKFIAVVGRPIVVSLLEMIKTFFEYGLIKISSCETLIFHLYQTSETLKNIELQIDEAFGNIEKEEQLEKHKEIYTFLRICRESMSEILIHIFTLYNDYAFMNSLKEIRKKNTQINYFKGSLFHKQKNYRHFSSIVVGYLTKPFLGKNYAIDTRKLDCNLKIIFNFLGDLQNDNFEVSLDLIKAPYYSYYTKLKKKEQVKENHDEIKKCFNDFKEELKNKGAMSTGEINDLFSKMIDEIDKILQKVCLKNKEGSLTIDLKLKLELCLNGFIGNFISAIYMLNGNEEYWGSDRTKGNVDKALIILKTILIGNYPGQAILFSENGYKYLFNTLFGFELSSVMFLKEVFQNDSLLFFLSKDFFMRCVNKYKEKLDQIFKTIEGLKNTFKNTKNSFYEQVSVLFFFNAFFNNLLEDHKIKIRRRKRYDLILADCLVDGMNKFVIPYFFNDRNIKRLETLEEFTFENNFVDQKLEDHREVIEMIKEKGDDWILSQFYYSLFKLFNKSTYKVDRKEILYKLEHHLPRYKAFPPFKKFRQILFIRLEFLKLCGKSIIFTYSHIQPTTTEQTHHHDLTIVQDKDKMILVFDLMSKEIEWFKVFINEYDFEKKDIKEEDRKNFEDNTRKYLYKGFLSTFYKILKYTSTNLTKLESATYIYFFKSQFYYMLYCFNSCFSHLRFFLTLPKSLKKTIFPENLDFKDGKKGFIPTSLGKIDIRNGSLEKFEKERGIVFEEKKIKSLLSIHYEIGKKTKGIKEIYRSAEKDFIIDRYIGLRNQENRKDLEDIKDPENIEDLENIENIEDLKNLNNLEDPEDRKDYIKKLFRSPNDLRLKNKNFRNKIRQGKYKAKFKSQFKLLKKKYTITKILFQEGEKTNMFYNILDSAKDPRESICNVIDFFYNQFCKVEPELIEGKTDSYYQFDEFFFSALMMLDNLMFRNNRVRVYFCQYLENKDIEKQKKFIEKLWSIFKILYVKICFKGFLDDQWKHLWGQFFILSNFLQNLNEDNNLKFKKLFNTIYLERKLFNSLNDKSEVKNELESFSLFQENHLLLYNLNFSSDLWKNKETRIVPSDRERLFPVFVRLFGMVNEHITGPRRVNQMMIVEEANHFIRWRGIIERVIDDLDSNFYEVKLACLIFINSLLEGLDDTIVSFMGINLNVDDLFKMIVTLTKKLFVRQRLINKNELKIKFQEKPKRDDNKFLDDYNEKIEGIRRTQRFNVNTSIITKEQELEFTLKSHKELINMYKKYSSSFSDHIILKIVTMIFVLLTNMSFKVQFFEFFIKDKRKAVEKIKKKKTRKQISKEYLEHIIIFQFLERIVTNIELVYEDQNTKKLLKIFFNIPPECFFLTQDMKDSFLEKINIETINSKHIDLFNIVKPFHKEIQINKIYYRRFGFFSFFASNKFFRINQFLIYAATVGLNLMMMDYIIFDPGAESGSGALKEMGQQENSIIIRKSNGFLKLKIFSWVVTVYSFAILIMWILLKSNIWIGIKVLTRKLKKKKEDEEEEERKGEEEGEEEKENSRLFSKFSIYSLFQPKLISFFLHFIFTFIGIITEEYVFFTLNLFLLANLSKTIDYILKSIFKHYGKLLITLLLTVLVIFCYSFLAYTYYREDQHGDYEGFCDTFLTCFINSVNLGLKLGGGVSDAFNLKGDLRRTEENHLNTRHFYNRFLFDLSFFILIKLIFLNLIAGIIIDTFSNMRNELNQRTFDTNNICNICGKSRWQLEKEGILFEDHTRWNHNIWNYLYYLIRLRTVDEIDFTGIEQYVTQKTGNFDSSWIPQGIYLKENTNIEIINEDK